jgi:hypothetical protein
MQRLEGAPLEKLASGLKDGISMLYLEEHLRLVVLFKNGSTEVELEPSTDFGTEVLKELKTRSVVTPCPPGECDFKGDSCIWCGEPKKA